jgi:elongation factor Ts
MIGAKQIQELRAKSGMAIMECKKALEEAKGDEKTAMEILKKCGEVKALKKSERVTSQGIVGTYSHGGGRIGVMIEVNCETDFVARNEEFKNMVHDLCMQIASMKPKDVTELKKQSFIKNLDVTIGEMLTEKIAKIGENIQIKRFVRYELGE